MRKYGMSVKETPVRVSSEISIRKHTLYQIPYYHTHDFYELIYAYRGRGGQYLAGEKDIGLKLILPRTAVKDLMSEFRTDGSLSG